MNFCSMNFCLRNVIDLQCVEVMFELATPCVSHRDEVDLW